MINIGKLVNTHGLKGETKIISDFKYKLEVFKKGNNVYIGNDKLEINSYRPHQIYDMLTFVGINSIDDVLKYKGEEVYIDRDEYEFAGILDEDIIGMEVYGNDKLIGIVSEIFKNKVHSILVIEKNGNINMVPYVDEFIKNIDLKNKRLEINIIEGLINED